MAGRMVLLGGVMLGVLAVVVEWWRGGLWCGHVSLCFVCGFPYVGGGGSVFVGGWEGGEVSLVLLMLDSLMGMDKRLLATGWLHAHLRMITTYSSRY